MGGQTDDGIPTSGCGRAPLSRSGGCGRPRRSAFWKAPSTIRTTGWWATRCWVCILPRRRAWRRLVSPWRAIRGLRVSRSTAAWVMGRIASADVHSRAELSDERRKRAGAQHGAAGALIEVRRYESQALESLAVAAARCRSRRGCRAGEGAGGNSGTGGRAGIRAGADRNKAGWPEFSFSALSRVRKPLADARGSVTCDFRLI